MWGSPTIDARRRIIYLTTSNAYTLPAADTSDSVMALDMEIRPAPLGAPTDAQ